MNVFDKYSLKPKDIITIKPLEECKKFRNVYPNFTDEMDDLCSKSYEVRDKTLFSSILFSVLNQYWTHSTLWCEDFIIRDHQILIGDE